MRTTDRNPSDDVPRGGEGDHEAARRYNERARAFTASDAARQARDELGTRSDAECREDDAARREAAGRAAEKDPGVTRDYRKPED